MTQPPTKRELATLRLHPVAARLLDGPDSDALFRLEADTKPLEILIGGTVLTGIAVFLAAVKSKRKRAVVRVREDLVDEDPAFVAGIVVKELLGGSKDPLVLGTVWGAFTSYLKTVTRPRKGFKHDLYVRRHGMSAVERLQAIIVDTFGFSDDQLARFARLVSLPAELQGAYRREAVTLRSLDMLSKQPLSVIDDVVAAIKQGTPAEEAVTAALPQSDTRPTALTAVRRLIRAGKAAEVDFAGRHAECGFLPADERVGVIKTKEFAESLLALPTEAEVLTDIARIIEANKRDRSAGSGVNVVTSPDASERGDEEGEQSPRNEAEPEE